MRLLVLPGMDGGASLSHSFRARLAERWTVEAVEYPTDEAPPIESLATTIAAAIERSAEPVALLGEDAVRSTIARNAEGVLVDRVRQALAIDLRDTLRDLPVPLLALRARRDRLVPRAAAPEAHLSVAHVEVDAPHLGLHAAPEACATIVAAQLQRWDRQRRSGL